MARYPRAFWIHLYTGFGAHHGIKGASATTRDLTLVLTRSSSFFEWSFKAKKPNAARAFSAVKDTVFTAVGHAQRSSDTWSMWGLTKRGGGQN